jgi:hypothetical protein
MRLCCSTIINCARFFGCSSGSYPKQKLNFSGISVTRYGPPLSPLDPANTAPNSTDANTNTAPNSTEANTTTVTSATATDAKSVNFAATATNTKSAKSAPTPATNTKSAKSANTSDATDAATTTTTKSTTKSANTATADAPPTTTDTNTATKSATATDAGSAATDAKSDTSAGSVSSAKSEDNLPTSATNTDSSRRLKSERPTLNLSQYSTSPLHRISDTSSKSANTTTGSISLPVCTVGGVVTNPFSVCSSPQSISDSCIRLNTSCWLGSMLSETLFGAIIENIMESFWDVGVTVKPCS